MKRLLRSVIDLERPQDADALSYDQLTHNYLRMETALTRERGLRFLVPDDERLWAVIQAHYEEHKRPPSYAYLLARFENDVEATERLQDIYKCQAYARTAFGHILEQLTNQSIFGTVKTALSDGLAALNPKSEKFEEQILTLATSLKGLANNITTLKANKRTWESRWIDVPQDWYEIEPPKRKWLLTDNRAGNEGVLPLGKVGMIAAEGGAGKTTFGIEMGIAVSTGTQFLNAFHTPNPGKVLLALAEEDMEEAWRRVYKACKALGTRPDPGKLVLLPLAGERVSMLDDDGNEAPFLDEFREKLLSAGSFQLVVIDPIARFAGADTEMDNNAATRFVIALESLIEASKGATILGMHHTNQQARGKGARGSLDITAIRGVTGIGDAMRWASVLQVQRPETDDEGKTAETTITMAMVKSNYSMYADPVVMRYGEGGILIPLTEDERQDVRQATSKSAKKEAAKSKAAQEQDKHAVAAVKQEPGIAYEPWRNQVMARAACGKDTATVAMTRVVNAGYVRMEKRGKAHCHYFVKDVPTSIVSEAKSPSDMIESDEDFSWMVHSAANGVSP